MSLSIFLQGKNLFVMVEDAKRIFSYSNAASMQEQLIMQIESEGVRGSCCLPSNVEEL